MSLTTYEAGHSNDVTVVLLHGGFLLHRMWTPQLAPLAQRYHILAPDLFYDELPRITIRNLASDVATLIEDKAHDKRAYVVGLSFGAVVATQLSILKPDLVKGAIISAGRVRGEIGDAVIRRMLQVMPKSWLMNNFLRQTIELCPELDGPAQEDMARIGKTGFIQTVKAIGDVDFSMHLSAIRVPTLVVVGGDDRPGFLRDAGALANAIPDAQLRIIPEVGHGWNLEEPDTFTEMVIDFVTEQEAQTTGA